MSERLSHVRKALTRDENRGRKAVPSGACFASLNGANQRRLRAEAERSLSVPDAPFTLEARAWWVRGLAPAP
jgi:hypothetical protein